MNYINTTMMNSYSNAYAGFTSGQSLVSGSAGTVTYWNKVSMNWTPGGQLPPLLNKLFLDDTTSGTGMSDPMFAADASRNLVIRSKVPTGGYTYASRDLAGVTSAVLKDQNVVDVNLIGLLTNQTSVNQLRALYAMHAALDYTVVMSVQKAVTAIPVRVPKVSYAAGDLSMATVYDTFTLRLETTNNRYVLDVPAGGANADNVAVCLLVNNDAEISSVSPVNSTVDSSQVIMQKTPNTFMNIHNVITGAATDKIESVVLRRIMFMFVQMFNFKIAINIQQNTGAGGNAAKGNILVDAVYSYLFKLNYDITVESGSGVLLNKRINKRFDKNKQNIDKIKALDDQLDSSKNYFNTHKQLLDQQNEVVRKANAYAYGGLAVLLFICLVGTFLFVVMHYEKVLMAGSALLIITFVVGISLYMAFVKKIEPDIKYARNDVAESFVGESDTAALAAQAVTPSLETEKLQFEVFFDQVSQFMSNTVFISNTLRTYKTYGNYNNTTRREILFFQGIYDQMQNSSAKLRAALSLTAFNIMMNKYKMMFFLILAFIVALTLTTHSMATDQPRVQTGIIAFACILTISIFTVFVMITNRMVHTNSRRRYFGGKMEGGDN